MNSKIIKYLDMSMEKFISPLNKFEIYLNQYSFINHIDFWQCDVTNKHLRCINMINVTQIRLLECDQISDVCMIYLQNIKIIYLDSVNITDNGIFYLQQVTRIYLRNIDRLTDKGLKYMCNISRITLSNCNAITDVGLKYLASAQKIHLNHCPKITGRGFIYLSKATRIKITCHVENVIDVVLPETDKLVLSFSWCRLDIPTFTLRSSLSKFIHLDRCNISADTIAYLSNLNKIILTDCNIITDRALQYLSSVPNVEISCYEYRNDGWKIQLKGSNSVYAKTYINETPWIST